jgi:2-haloacid dehalogenase
MIKKILLDLDDTVLDFHKGEGIAIEKTLAAFGVEPTEDVISLYRQCNRFCWASLERGEMEREDVLIYRFKMVFDKLGVSEDPHKVQYVYERNLAAECHFIEGAEETVKSLSEKYDLYIASNGTAFVQDRRIAKSGIEKYCKSIFISERIGANKPSREFFDGCFEKMGDVNKDEIMIVGDSLSSDILGGINAGIRTCHVDPTGSSVYSEIKPDHTVGYLYEVPELLKTL